MWTPGPSELLVIALLLLVFFGAKRLPELGRSLGSGIKEFKKGLTAPSPDEETSALTNDEGKKENSTKAP